MFYKLHDKLLLRGWQKLPYALLEQEQQFISYKEMEALKLCNGLIDTSLPLIPQEIRDVLPRLEKNGWIIPCERGDSIRPEQEYKLYPARYIRTAHWSITTIYSNGKLVTEELLDQLAERGIHPEFNMSYDGVDGWHDWLRGIPNAGKIAEDAFLRCKRKGFPTGALMCENYVARRYT